MEIKNSFTSANSELPIKLIKNDAFARACAHGYIRPAHLQFAPTNRCDAECSFCSCSNRDKALEIDINIARAAIEMFAQLGSTSVTITGGGEPMCYPHIYEFIEIFIKNRIEVGLVTNGRKWKRWDTEALGKLRWLRMSISDEYPFDEFEKQISTIARSLHGVDVAISYVAGGNPDYGKMRMVVNAANEFGLTHVRIVHNIINPVGEIDFTSRFMNMDLSKVIYQPRQKFERGISQCLISLAKPMIGAGGKIYPCCGVQYASEKQSLDLSADFAMGDIADAPEIWRHQWAYDGARCARCYYGGYNRLLAAMITPVRHIEFI